MMLNYYLNEIEEVIEYALHEDVREGDITSEAIFTNQSASAVFLVKSDGVIAGLEVAKKVFEIVDTSVEFIAFFTDTTPVKKGDIIAKVNGNAISILTAERTALNFLQRMSGIATITAKYQNAVSHTKAKIIDTRKTVPGLRLLDKIAVRAGGAENHRIGLYDMFLIKDNHIAVAGSITNAVNACRKFNLIKGKEYKIEVETTNLDQVKEALILNVDRIMLDNFSTEQMKKAVEYINGKCEVEASGGITLDSIKKVAETGVDFISVGALTHSVVALDISLDVTIS
jgi:nicotinate-nucleotide pyrophosphorylase (carboxylating)